MQLQDSIGDYLQAFLVDGDFLALVNSSPLALGGESRSIANRRRGPLRFPRFRSMLLPKCFPPRFGSLRERVETHEYEPWPEVPHEETPWKLSLIHHICDRCQGDVSRLELVSAWQEDGLSFPAGNACRQQVVAMLCPDCALDFVASHPSGADDGWECPGLDMRISAKARRRGETRVARHIRGSADHACELSLRR